MSPEPTCPLTSSAHGDDGVTSTCRLKDSMESDLKEREIESSFKIYPWLEKVKDGYLCKYCNKYGQNTAQNKGVWISVPVSKLLSKRLREKAKKHHESLTHKLATTRVNNESSATLNVHEQLLENESKHELRSETVRKEMFKYAYYLFSTESAHTTLWRELISTVAAVDCKGELCTFVTQQPGNNHYLSTYTITKFLEAFGDAIVQVQKKRLCNVKKCAILADECTDINGREMLSICLRFLEDTRIVEMFLCVKHVLATTANVICETMLSAVAQYNIKPEQIIAASFDGASNFSGRINGVSAQLRRTSPKLVYVHCRSHLLQLALVKSANAVPEIKRCLNVLNKIYTLFKGSPKRLLMLSETEKAIDGCSHKLVQPGPTRWLSYEGSVSVVCRHYGAICHALESVYVDAGDLSCEAGGILLTMRNKSNYFFLKILSHFLVPLARLSRSLQCSTADIPTAIQLAKCVIEELKQTDVPALMAQAKELTSSLAKDSNVRFDDDINLTEKQQVSLAKNFCKAVTDSLEQRFSDDVSSLSEIYTLLKNRPLDFDFRNVSNILGAEARCLAEEWRYVRRLPEPESGNVQDVLLELACSQERREMFPTFSELAEQLVLLPVGTAGVERSFSSMNRILSSTRCRLNPEHVNQLMQISIEGPVIPDVRNGTPAETRAYNDIINSAYAVWKKKPHPSGTS